MHCAYRGGRRPLAPARVVAWPLGSPAVSPQLPPEEHAIRTPSPFHSAQGTTFNHLLAARLRPDFTKAVGFGVLAVIAATVVRVFGDLRLTSMTATTIAVAGSVAFTVLAVIGVRTAAGEVARVSRIRFGDAHASVVALLLTLAGYAVTSLVLLILLRIPVERLLVSGAVTGVVLGIAAQQSLSNVVAGLVMLLNRPFQVGDEITLRSGALAGPYSGQVRSIGLTYVALDTEEGLVLLPNSGVLASAVGPRVTSDAT
jgi:small-conductance mechanosensitive channel